MKQQPEAWRAALAEALAGYRQGDYTTAEAACRRALAVRPRLAAAHRLLGAALQAQHRHGEAEQAYREALRLKPADTENHSALCRLLRETGRHGEALAACRQAVREQPGVAALHGNLAQVLLAMGRYARAEKQARKATALEPDYQWLNDLGVALLEQGKMRAAREILEQAAKQAPGKYQAWQNLAHLHELRHDTGELRTCLERLTAIDPGEAMAQVNLGLLYKGLGDLDAAARHMCRALDLDAALPQAHVGLAFVHFLRGEFDAAAPHYEYRLKLEAMQWREPDWPRWQGEDMKDGTLLLMGEQGFGDMLQFVRYVPQLQARCRAVVIGCHGSLQSLLQESFPAMRVVAKGDPCPEVDRYIPVLSVPGVMAATLDSIPAAVPYLGPAAKRVRDWQEHIPASEQPRIGLVWAGQPQHVNDRNRSIPLAGLAPLLARDDSLFYSLQLGERTAELATVPEAAGVTDLSPHIGDFHDTAAALACLDLVIAVDTAVVHLAGAMGRPVWTLLPFAPDWRWLLDRPDTPWYPSMRLFRQPAPGDWAGVVKAVSGALDRFVAESCN